MISYPVSFISFVAKLCENVIYAYCLKFASTLNLFQCNSAHTDSPELLIKVPKLSIVCVMLFPASTVLQMCTHSGHTSLYRFPSNSSFSAFFYSFFRTFQPLKLYLEASHIFHLTI